MLWIMAHQQAISFCHLVPAREIQSQHICLYLSWKFSLIQVQSNRNIQGSKIFGYEYKLSAFTDDVSCFLYTLHFVELRLPKNSLH